MVTSRTVRGRAWLDEELDAFTDGDSDLQESPGAIGADKQREVVEGEDSDGVAVGVEHVVVADPVFACTVEHDGIDLINVP